MFIINITYKVSNEEVDQHLESHIAFLNKQYELGIFLASGRKVPRTGGVILAKCEDRNVLQGVLEQDPFQLQGLANYKVIEFIPSKTAPGLESLL